MQIYQRNINEIRSNRLKFIRAIKGSMQQTKINSSLEKNNISNSKDPESLENQKTLEEDKELSSLSQGSNVIVDQQLSELFQVKQKIGVGSQSIVHRCIEKQTGKEFAVKIIRRCGTQILNSIKETNKLMKQLNHPNIIKVKNLFIQNDQEKCQIITEYFNCGDLRAYMRGLKANGKKMEEGQMVKIIQLILQSLKQLQQKRVCHRDIKPENILYDPKVGTLKIIDFEVARINKNSEEPMDLWTETGSLYYRAPESFGGGYDEKVDVWAVGVIAYEIIFGCLPFFNVHRETTRKLICDQQLQLKHGNISNNCKNLLEGLLNKDRQYRLTPKDALSHPFFDILVNSSKNQNSTNSISSNISSRIQQNDEKEFEQILIGRPRRRTLAG